MTSIKVRKSLPESRSKDARVNYPHLLPASLRRNTLPTPKSIMGSNVKSSPRKRPIRISRSAGAGQRRPQAKLTNADEFTNQMDQYRETISLQFEQGLDDVDRAHVELLNDLMEQFEAQLLLLSKADEPLQSSLATEILKVVIESTNRPDSQPVQFEEVVLQDRMLAFERLVKQEHKTLTRLIDDWNKIQSEILVLTVEMLGNDILHMNEEQIYDDLQAALKVANKQHDNAQQQFDKVYVHMAAFEERLNDITDQTKDTMRKQQQACKIATKKHLTQLQQTIQLLTGDS